MVDRTGINRQLNCEQVWHEISNYLEGEVDAGLRATMDEHFHTCKRCASVLEGTRNVIRLYGDERMIEVPAGFGRRLEKSIEKRVAQNARANRRGWSVWSAWLVPVAALVVITAGVWMTNSYTTARREKSEMAAIERNIPQDMQVVVSDGAKVFHVAGCPYMHNKDKARTITAKEAIQDGYTPCLHCLRKYVDTTAVVAHPALGPVADARDADAEDEKHEGGQ